MSTDILSALQMIGDLQLAVIFGSVAQGKARADSDLDIAVRYAAPLDAERKLALIRALGAASGRPVDLIDLRTAGPSLQDKPSRSANACSELTPISPHNSAAP